MARVIYNGNKTDYYDVTGSSITASTQPDENSGAVMGISTAALDSSKFIGVTLGDAIVQDQQNLAERSGWGTTGVRSGGTFAHQAEGEYVVLGYTTSLNNAANTTIQSAGSSRPDQGKSLHPLAALRTRHVATAIRAGYWNEYSGTWSTTPTTGNDFSTMGTDDAAAPTTAVPGELTYMYGNPVPATGEYSAKTSA